ncbi:MAG TPA: hypothetical protein VF188_08235 [Longimicrobiales bacterium]
MNKVLQIIIRAKDTTSAAFGAVRRRMLAIGRVAKDVAKGVAVIGGSIAGAITGLALLTRRGGEVLNVQGAFQRVTGDSAAALEQLRSATQGLISDFDLMAGFNQAIALGSARSTEEFARMSQIALGLSRTLGIDAKFALESLNTGIARQSKLFLDNLGIIVDVEAANARYAAQLGKQAKDLTDLEKREAFRAAALAAGERAVGKLGTGSATAGDQVTRFMATLRNFRDELAKVLATSPDVQRFFEVLTTSLASLQKRLPQIAQALSEFGEIALSIFDPVSVEAGREIASIKNQPNFRDPRFLRAASVIRNRELVRLLGERSRIEADFQRFLGGRSIRELTRQEIEQRVPFSRLRDVNRFFELERQIAVVKRVLEFLAQQLHEAATPQTRAPQAPSGPPAPVVSGGGATFLGFSRILTPANFFGGAPMPAPGTLGATNLFTGPLVDPLQSAIAQVFAGQGLSAHTLVAGAFEFLEDTEKQLDRLARGSTEGANALASAAETAVAAFGAMTQAAIEGSEITAQSVVSMVTDIVRALPGVGQFAGAVIGAVGGVLGALIGRGDRDPVPVRVTDFDRPAEEKLQRRSDGPDVRQPIIIDATTGRRVDEVEYLLGRRTRTDATPRFVDQRPGGAG